MPNRKLSFISWLLAGLLALTPCWAGTLLPNGEQTFVDANGQPYSSGKVYFYIPATTTPKNTWTDPGQTVLNANPVVLDAAGRAIIYGTGSYRQVLKDQYGNTIWDQLTQGAGGSGSVVNTTITGSTTLSACSGIYPINNASAAPITINMTTSPADGDTCQFMDVGNNSSTYAITLYLGAKVMNTGGSNYFMNSSGMAVFMTWLATPATWVVN